MIALDTETSLISDEEPVPRLVCAVLAWGDRQRTDLAEVVHHSDPDLESLLRDALAGDIALCNAPFDLAVIIERFPALEPYVWRCYERSDQGFRSAGGVKDVSTRERLLDLAQGKGLKRSYSLGDVAHRRAGIELDKSDPWRLRYAELIDTPVRDWPETALHYARNDGTSTFAAYWAQHVAAEAFRRDTGFHPLEDAARQARGHWALHLSSLHGVTVDPVAVDALDKRLLHEMATCLDALVTCGLARKDGSRDTKIAQELARACGATALTDGGDISLDEESLSALALPPAHPLSLYRKYGSIMGLRSRSLKPLQDQAIVRTRYTELLENGRTSSSGMKDKATGRYKGANLQNMPRGNDPNAPWEKGFRECLVPRPGCVFVGGDWSKMELGTVAQVLLWLFGADAPTAALANALNAGRDPHTELGRRINSGDPVRDRQQAKPGNFGFWGAMGLERFVGYARSQGCIISLEDAQKIKRAFGDEWHPWAYFDWIRDHAEDGIVQFLSGRVRGGTSYTDACNGVWSGLAADIAKHCLWRIAKELYAPENGYEVTDLSGARQVLFVHDENVLECPRERADNVAARLKWIMEDSFSLWCDGVRCKADVKVMERYTK